MDGNNWQVIMKNEMQLYSEFKRRNPHFWNEAQQLPGNNEVATLDSVSYTHLTLPTILRV